MDTTPLNESQAQEILRALGVEALVVTSSLDLGRPETLVGFENFKRALLLAYEKGARGAPPPDDVAFGGFLVMDSLKILGVDQFTVTADPDSDGFRHFHKSLEIAYQKGAAFLAHQGEPDGSMPSWNQFEALYEYVIAQGRDWKSKLKAEWDGNEINVAFSPLLTQVKEQFGYDWLKDFDLSKNISNGRLAHQLWERSRGDEQEFAAELRISKIVERLGGNMDQWWKSWLLRSDEWNETLPEAPDRLPTKPH